MTEIRRHMTEIVGISGTSGFIGSRLAEHFSTEQVERLDRTGYIPPNISIVFDLAGFGNMYGQNDIHEIYRANLMRVIHEMDYLGDARYIYISTSSVTLPIQTPYSLSKKAAEEFLKHIGRNIAIVRPFTIIGVGEQKEHLIPRLIDSCLNGTKMPFIPEPVHDFLDVDDFVDALLIIKDKAQFKGEIYEVGSGVQTSNDQVRVLVEDITGKKSNIRLVDGVRSYDTREWRSNNERIYSLDWKPKKILHDIIREMVEYARKNITD